MQMEAAIAIIQIKCFDPEFLLIKRATHPKDPWSGHLSFPGGRLEAKDSNLMETCIRETREECGIELNAAQLISKLPIAIATHASKPAVTVSPFLFALDSKPIFYQSL